MWEGLVPLVNNLQGTRQNSLHDPCTAIYADQDIDDGVAEKTRAGDWSIDTSGNPYDSNTVFYRHVSSAAEIEETVETLVDHFSTFGGEYAVASDRAVD